MKMITIMVIIKSDKYNQKNNFIIIIIKFTFLLVIILL